MRVKINYTKNDTPVPIQNQSYINSYIHRKCLGENNKYHDTKSDYCISKLCGGVRDEITNTLSFKNGGFICVTSNNQTFLGEIIAGTLKNPNLGWGMKFKTFEYINEDFIGSNMKKQQNVWHHFRTLSPFLIREYTDKKNYSEVTLNDTNFSEKVKLYLINKLSAIYKDIDLTGFEVKHEPRPFDKIKKILVKNTINSANQCQISIFCTADVAEKIYTLGIGQSTGSGFGTIYKTENHKKYITL